MQHLCFSIIVTGTLAACEAFFGFNSLSPSNVSFGKANLKLNFGLSTLIILFLTDYTWVIFIFFQCKYSRVSKEFNWWFLNSNDKFLAMLQKYLLNVFAIPSSFTAWKVSKYGIISGPYFHVFSPNTVKYGPEITPYLVTFLAVIR